MHSRHPSSAPPQLKDTPTSFTPVERLYPPVHGHPSLYQHNGPLRIGFPQSIDPRNSPADSAFQGVILFPHPRFPRPYFTDTTTPGDISPNGTASPNNSNHNHRLTESSIQPSDASGDEPLQGVCACLESCSQPEDSCSNHEQREVERLLTALPQNADIPELTGTNLEDQDIREHQEPLHSQLQSLQNLHVPPDIREFEESSHPQPHSPQEPNLSPKLVSFTSKIHRRRAALRAEQRIKELNKDNGDLDFEDSGERTRRYIRPNSHTNPLRRHYCTLCDKSYASNLDLKRHESSLSHLDNLRWQHTPDVGSPQELASSQSGFRQRQAVMRAEHRRIEKLNRDGAEMSRVRRVIQVESSDEDDDSKSEDSGVITRTNGTLRQESHIKVFHCTLCDKPFESNLDLKRHESSLGHLDNLGWQHTPGVSSPQELTSQSGPRRSNAKSLRRHYCTVCHTTYASNWCFKRHEHSNNHLARLQLTQGVSSPQELAYTKGEDSGAKTHPNATTHQGPYSGPFHCAPCDKYCGRKFDLRRHELSDGHLKRLEEMQGNSSPISTFVCENCGTRLSRQDAVLRHQKESGKCLKFMSRATRVIKIECSEDDDHSKG